jgi:hypothetical protein
MNLISKNISGQVQEIENEIVTLKAAAYAKAKKCNSALMQTASRNLLN